MSLAAVETHSKLPDLDRVPRVDEVGVNERVAVDNYEECIAFNQAVIRRAAK